MPMITSNPAWPEQERIDSGVIFNPQSLYETINALAGPDGVETTKGFIGNMVTKSIPQEEKDWIIERNLTMPRQHVATLLYNHSTQDWRDLIPRLQLPALVVGGRVSVVPWQSQEWIAKQIPGVGSRSSRRRTAATTSCSSRATRSSTRSSPTSWAEPAHPCAARAQPRAPAPRTVLHRDRVAAAAGRSGFAAVRFLAS